MGRRVMKKMCLLGAVPCLAVILPLSIGEAKNLEFIVADYSRFDGGYVIRFFVRKNYTYDRNPFVALRYWLETYHLRASKSH
jgi:hypothetical protein